MDEFNILITLTHTAVLVVSVLLPFIKLALPSPLASDEQKPKRLRVYNG